MKSGSNISSTSNSNSTPITGPGAGSHDILKPKGSCAKVIGASKYETNSPDTQLWWSDKFKCLEEKSTMPFYKRKNHLENCFSKETLKKLISSGIEINQDWGEDLEKTIPKSVVCPNPKIELAPKVSLEQLSSEPEKEYTNPYLNFFRKSEKNAQIWRPRPKPTIETLPLIKKAQLLEEKIATEFDEWFSNVGSKVSSEIDKDVILSIFEIVMSYPIMTSIFQRIFEIGSVPERTAGYLCFPEKSESASVQREIRKDIRAGKQKPMLVAFLKTLPVELKRQPFVENLKEKWFEYQIQHKDLETMAAVWKGITELHTTRVFINWLLDHPEVDAPPYLESEGLMDYQHIAKSLIDFQFFDDFDTETIQS